MTEKEALLQVMIDGHRLLDWTLAYNSIQGSLIAEVGNISVRFLDDPELAEIQIASWLGISTLTVVLEIGEDGQIEDVTPWSFRATALPWADRERQRTISYSTESHTLRLMASWLEEVFMVHKPVFLPMLVEAFKSTEPALCVSPNSSASE